MTLKVSGIFYSVQGEGPKVGRPAIFIRLAGCNFNCSWCFVGNTKIKMTKGTKPIKNIRPGNVILSWNGTEIIEDIVTKKFSRTVPILDLLSVSFKEVTKHYNLFVTKEHPFILCSGKIVKAKDLQAGDQVFFLSPSNLQSWRMKGQKNAIFRMSPVTQKQCARFGVKFRGKNGSGTLVKVFNFQTQKTHKFFANSVLVHNCDTPYAKKAVPGKHEEMTEEEILEFIGKYPCSYVVLTGGEPFIQPITELLALLTYKHYTIDVETNGSIRKPYLNQYIDTFVVSPKPPSSGMKTDFKILENIILDRCNSHQETVLKVVVTDEKDYEYAKKLWLDYFDRVSFIFQLESQKEIDSEKANWLIEKVKTDPDLYNRDKVRVMVQMQKIIWGNQRGV